MSGGIGAINDRRPAPPGPRTGDPAGAWPRASTLELAARPASVPLGRGHVRRVLREWELGHLAGDAELVASESLANAMTASLAAGGAMVALRLLAGRERVLIEVWDSSPADPWPGQAGDLDESGRGLAVIAGISHRWGCRRADPGLKVVWCELLTGLTPGR